MKVYLAGPMFTKAEVEMRLFEAGEARKLLDVFNNITGKNLEVDFYVPLEQDDINDKSNLPTAKAIFETDKDALFECDAILACLDGEDAGVMAELGIAYSKGLSIHCFMTDMRIANAGDYEGIYVPYGYNQFIIGLAETYAPIEKDFTTSLMGLFQALARDSK